MITPKPKSVFELFDGHPERWLQGCNCKSPNGKRVHPTADAASQWSVDGAITSVYGEGSYEADAATIALWRKVPSHTIEWNDDPATTFEQMLAKVKEAGI